MSVFFTRSLKKILTEFALHKEIYQGSVHEIVGKSRYTAQHNLHKMKDEGYIQLIRKEESRARGMKKNVWGITIKGLVVHFLFCEYKKLAEIARAHPDKLLVFKKWDFFEKEGVLPIIDITFKKALVSIYRNNIMRLIQYGSMLNSKMDLKTIQNTLDSMTLGCYNMRFPSQIEPELYDLSCTLLGVCNRDDDLRNFIGEELAYFVKVDSFNLKQLKHAEQINQMTE